MVRLRRGLKPCGRRKGATPGVEAAAAVFFQDGRVEGARRRRKPAAKPHQISFRYICGQRTCIC